METMKENKEKVVRNGPFSKTVLKCKIFLKSVNA